MPMTIARGLTRMKTIKKQLSEIETIFQKYAAWPNNKKHPMGNTKLDLKQNLKSAEEEIRSLYQQYNDLVNEYVKIKLAIEKANIATEITIAGKTMTIANALILRRDIAQHFNLLANAYNHAVKNADVEVQKNNQSVLANVNLDTDKKALLMAEVHYLVPQEEVNNMSNFVNVFMTEIDGELNAINAMTPIEHE